MRVSAEWVLVRYRPYLPEMKPYYTVVRSVTSAEVTVSKEEEWAELAKGTYEDMRRMCKLAQGG